jgi:Tfp pilus assembly protein PilX
MATILDISGKPLPNRKRGKSRLKAQDARDLFKIVILLLLIIIGFFLFAPSRNAAEEIRIAAAQRADG